MSDDQFSNAMLLQRLTEIHTDLNAFRSELHDDVEVLRRESAEFKLEVTRDVAVLSSKVKRVWAIVWLGLVGFVTFVASSLK